MQKRCYSTAEAMQYLGVKRRFFDTNIVPLLADQGIRAGTSIVYERVSLDAAWDRYKLSLGNERPAQPEGSSKTWDVQQQPQQVFTRRRTEHTRSTQPTENSAFEGAVSRGMQMRKHG